MRISRRDWLSLTVVGGLAELARTPAAARAQSGTTPAAIEGDDRVFIANEESNTVAVIDPRTNAVESTINLTGFDEDPRPALRFVTGGVVPSHAAMIGKP